MAQKINYQLKLEEILKNIEENKKMHLMLHSCCAPCSSYVLEYLQKYFKITVFYYNPNISPKEEFEFRLEEQKRLILEMNLSDEIDVIAGKYEPEEFYSLAKGLENLPEDSERCYRCYKLRLKKTAQIAKEHNCDYFCTTLSISPHKNADKLNEIGEEIGEEVGIKYLNSDFKKKDGYKRSCQLSEIYNLYRQDYCGCVYSKNNALPKSSSGNGKSI